MTLKWVLIVYLQSFTGDPIALTATSREHCLQMMEYAKSIKEYESSICMPQWSIEEWK